MLNINYDSIVASRFIKEFLYIVFCFLLHFSSHTQSCLRVIFADAKKNYADIPKSQDSPLENWIEPYDETYLPFHVCNDPKSLFC